MKHLIFCTLMLISIQLFAQNGGQAPENNSVKLEFAGYGTVKVTNKQSCVAVVRVTYNNTTIDYSIPGNDAVNITTPVPGLVRAKAVTNCGSADFGNVELNITAQLLPVKFTSLKAIPLGDNMIQVSFETAETINVKQFNIQISPDSRNWKTVAIILPDNVQPNRLYSVKINLTPKN